MFGFLRKLRAKRELERLLRAERVAREREVLQIFADKFGVSTEELAKDFDRTKYSSAREVILKQRPHGKDARGA